MPLHLRPPIKPVALECPNERIPKARNKKSEQLHLGSMTLTRSILSSQRRFSFPGNTKQNDSVLNKRCLPHMSPYWVGLWSTVTGTGLGLWERKQVTA